MSRHRSKTRGLRWFHQIAFPKHLRQFPVHVEIFLTHQIIDRAAVHGFGQILVCSDLILRFVNIVNLNAHLVAYLAQD